MLALLLPAEHLHIYTNASEVSAEARRASSDANGARGERHGARTPKDADNMWKAAGAGDTRA